MVRLMSGILLRHVASENPTRGLVATSCAVLPDRPGRDRRSGRRVVIAFLRVMKPDWAPGRASRAACSRLSSRLRMGGLRSTAAMAHRAHRRSDLLSSLHNETRSVSRPDQRRSAEYFAHAPLLSFISMPNESAGAPRNGCLGARTNAGSSARQGQRTAPCSFRAPGRGSPCGRTNRAGARRARPIRRLARSWRGRTSPRVFVDDPPRRRLEAPDDSLSCLGPVLIGSVDRIGPESDVSRRPSEEQDRVDMLARGTARSRSVITTRRPSR